MEASLKKSIEVEIDDPDYVDECVLPEMATMPIFCHGGWKNRLQHKIKNNRKIKKTKKNKKPHPRKTKRTNPRRTKQLKQPKQKISKKTQ